METQNYKNHVRYYTPHHFIFYPLLMVLLAISIVQAYKNPEQQILWIMLAAVWIMLGWLSFMLRQHYALGNQNRVVRLEMRLRYYQLTNEKFEPIEKQLNFSQLSALRFAADTELVRLIEKTLKENLSADTIKKSIVNWQPDHMRV